MFLCVPSNCILWRHVKMHRDLLPHRYQTTSVEQKRANSKIPVPQVKVKYGTWIPLINRSHYRVKVGSHFLHLTTLVVQMSCIRIGCKRCKALVISPSLRVRYCTGNPLCREAGLAHCLVTPKDTLCVWIWQEECVTKHQYVMSWSENRFLILFMLTANYTVCWTTEAYLSPSRYASYIVIHPPPRLDSCNWPGILKNINSRQVLHLLCARCWYSVTFTGCPFARWPWDGGAALTSHRHLLIFSMVTAQGQVKPIQRMSFVFVNGKQHWRLN